MNFIKIYLTAIFLNITLHAGNEAALKIVPKELDFGSISNLKSVEKSVTFKNIGKETVSIDKLRLSCGCAAVDYKKGEIIKSGKVHQIKIRFEPKEYKGRVRKPVFVQYSLNSKENSSSKQKKITDFYIRAKVNQDLSVFPTEIAFKQPGKIKLNQFLLKNKTKLKISDLLINPDKDFLKITIENDDEKPGLSLIKVELKESYKEKSINYANISIKGKLGETPFDLKQVVKLYPNH